MAAQKGVVTFIGVSGRKYSKQVYFGDVANTLVNWDAGNGASTTSPQYGVLPEHGVMVDLVLAAATGQTQTQICRNNVPTGDFLLNAVHLATVSQRPPLSIPVAAGQQISLIQIA